MRLVCPKGLFKGCLLVTEDPGLCKPGCVVFRKSMQKALGSERFKKGDVDTVSIDVLNTFEVPQGKGTGTLHGIFCRILIVKCTEHSAICFRRCGHTLIYWDVNLHSDLLPFSHSDLNTHTLHTHTQLHD